MGNTQRLLLAILLLGSTVFATASLINGADYLLWSVGPFPLGNVLVVLGLVGAPAAAWLYAGPQRWLRRFCIFAILLALLWYPISILMSGNLYLNFSGDRGEFWWVMTVASVLWSLLTPFVVVIIRLIGDEKA